MKSDELYDLFRSDVVDFKEPYLWSDDEVWLYMNDAYRRFVRLIGGVTDHMDVDIVTGEAEAEVSPSILKFLEVRLQNDPVTQKKLTVINFTDMPLSQQLDYNNIRSLYLNPQPGPVDYVIVGDRNRRRGIVTWVQTPLVDDTARMFVYRLPLVTIDRDGLDFDDVGEEHHEAFLLWMKHRAYSKQDAECFDRTKAAENKTLFEEYCARAFAEWERYKTKVRTVAYGGL